MSFEVKIFDINVIKRAGIFGNSLEIFLQAIMNNFFEKDTVVIQHLFYQQFTEASLHRCSEYMQQIYWRTPMSKCYFNKVAKQLFEIALRHGGSPLNLLYIFKAPFPKNTSGRAAILFSPVKLFISITMQTGNNFQVLLIQNFSLGKWKNG